METDLRLTADGIVVLSHDEDLRRTANDPRSVGEVMWAELADLDSGDGRGFVRLDDALYAHPTMRFNVDLKDSNVVQAALQTVRDAEALDRVRFASFSARRLAVLRRQEPRAMTSLGVSDVLGLMLRSEAAVPCRRRAGAGRAEGSTPSRSPRATTMSRWSPDGSSPPRIPPAWRSTCGRSMIPSRCASWPSSTWTPS